MIIIKVQGGLGNQLLQYSIGRIISWNNKREVAYDLSFFDQETKYTKRPYLLDVFKTSVRVATGEEIRSIRYPYGLFSKAYSFLFRLCNKFFFKKYYIGYEPDFFNKVAKYPSLYLEGYWQSYQYYEHYQDRLTREISLQDETSLETFKKEVSFASHESVSFHVRRSDFLIKGSGLDVLSITYYQKAVKFIEQEVPQPVYYIFSDDVEWVKKEMGHLFVNPVYVSHFDLTDYEEFALLKECKHAIIANSTFSFFSTLLGDNDTKIVIYPADWKNVYVSSQNFPICPPRWKKL